MDEKPQNPDQNGESGEETSTNLHRLSDSDTQAMASAPGSSLSADGQLDLVEAELEKTKKDYLYLLAEFENYKKHVIKERSDMRKYGSERLIVELLSVLDVFDTALRMDVTAENIDGFRKGVEMTATEFRAALQRFGVEELPAEGKPFDPNMHEAISSEATDKFPEGHVSKVFKKPFKLHDRVIRPGQVVVATKPKG